METLIISEVRNCWTSNTWTITLSWWKTIGVLPVLWTFVPCLLYWLQSLTIKHANDDLTRSKNFLWTIPWMLKTLINIGYKRDELYLTTVEMRTSAVVTACKIITINPWLSLVRILVMKLAGVVSNLFEFCSDRNIMHLVFITQHFQYKKCISCSNHQTKYRRTIKQT